jgi:hypothetical protein
MSTAEKINARMFFIAAYVAQPTDDRLQQASKEEIKTNKLNQVKDVQQVIGGYDKLSANSKGTILILLPVLSRSNLSTRGGTTEYGQGKVSDGFKDWKGMKFGKKSQRLFNNIQLNRILKVKDRLYCSKREHFQILKSTLRVEV